MGKKEELLTIGQLAELHYINKKTLMFYDKIGLFSPSVIGENGYRYYSYRQSLLLEKILFLRNCGVSIQDIKEQILSADAEGALEFLEAQRKKNQRQIRELKAYGRILKRKEEELRSALQVSENRIEWKELPEKRYIVSEPQTEEGDLYRYFSDLLSSIGEQHLYYYSMGEVINYEDLIRGEYGKGRMFLVCPPELAHAANVVRPAGRYLVCYWKGKWNTRPEACGALLKYAQEHGLRITGDVFAEDLINSFNTTCEDEYVTGFTVPAAETDVKTPGLSQ